MCVYPSHCFIWIEENKYNLLDADMQKLPRTGWVSMPNGQITNGRYVLDFAEGSQPNNPYLYNFGNLREII